MMNAERNSDAFSRNPSKDNNDDNKENKKRNNNNGGRRVSVKLPGGGPLITPLATGLPLLIPLLLRRRKKSEEQKNTYKHNGSPRGIKYNNTRSTGVYPGLKSTNSNFSTKKVSGGGGKTSGGGGGRRVTPGSNKPSSYVWHNAPISYWIPSKKIKYKAKPYTYTYFGGAKGGGGKTSGGGGGRRR